MELPSEELIEAVVSELDNDSCDKASGHQCETCLFSATLANRSTEDIPGAMDRFTITMLGHMVENHPDLSLVMAMGGPIIVTAFRTAVFQAALLGYKICKSQIDSKKISELMSLE